MKVLAIIPARAGSKRVPGKNKKLLGGKALYKWVLDEALKSKRITKLVLSSDDVDILEAAEKIAGVLSLKRPDNIADDQSPAIDYVRHVIEHYTKKGQFFDAFCILQPSSPFTRAVDVDACLEKLEQSGADTVVSVVKLPHDVNPIKMKTLEGDRLLAYLEEEESRMTADQLPELYVRNCSVYASKISVLDNNLIIGADCRAVVMPRERSVDINDLFDFSFAEFLAEKSLAEKLLPER